MPGFFKFKIGLVVLWVLLSACNTEKHYRTLSMLFDGVPRPESGKTEEAGTTKKNAQERLKLFDTTKGTSANVNRKAFNLPLSSHPDFQKKRCEKCHTVRHANRVKQRQPELCYECHTPFEERYKKLHGPVAAGFCNACHTPHQSPYVALLKRPVRDVCLHCHVSGDVKNNKAHNPDSERSCMDCHNAHGGSTANFLRKKT